VGVGLSAGWVGAGHVRIGSSPGRKDVRCLVLRPWLDAANCGNRFSARDTFSC
jgi:hypothetical protein